MKKLLLAFSLLTAFSCAGKQYRFTEGPTRIKLHGKRMAMVGRPWFSQVLIEGALPDGYVSFLVKIDRQPVAQGFGMVNSRVIDVPPLNFPEKLYYHKKGYTMPGEWATEEEVPYRAPPASGGEWDETIVVTVELWEAEPLGGGHYLRTKRLGSSDFKIKLSCPHCTV